MNNLSYKIYSSFEGWKPIGNVKEISQIIKTIDEHIELEDNAQYIVIEHNRDMNMDIPFKSIASIEEFIEFKEEYKPKEKILKR